MASLTFIDTNVLAYAFDFDDEAKQAHAARILGDLQGVVISTQVLLELFGVLTRKLQVSPDQAFAQVEDLLHLQVVPTDGQLVRDALSLSIESGISHWDAMVVTAASRAGCTTILTEDLNHGQVIAGVRVVDPFRDDSPG